MDREREVHWIGEDAAFARGNATRGEPMPDELAEVDPILQRFQEAPYDELASAAGGGRLVGLSVQTTVLRGWMRPVGYLVSLALLAFLAITVDTIITEVWISPAREPVSQNQLMTSLVGLPLGLAGGLMLWRLVRTRNQSDDSIH